MGTTVLNPQDCLSSPHSRQSDNFPGLTCRSASLGRPRRSGPPSPLASYMATYCNSVQKHRGSDHRRTTEGRSLPVPDDCSQSRPLPLSRSPKQNSRSISGRLIRSDSAARNAHTYSVPSSPSRHTSPPFSSTKPITERSVSSGLPPRRASTAGYAREARGSVNGRSPSKNVQGGHVFTANAKQNFQILPKFRDTKGVPQKKRLGASNHVSDLKKRTSQDVSVGLVEKIGEKPTRRIQEGSYGVKGLLNDVVMGKGGRGKSGTDEGEKMQGSATAVTILRRPKDKEAAEELFARFFQKVGGSSSSDGSDIENVKAEEGSVCEDVLSDDLESKCSTCSSADVISWAKTVQNEHCGDGDKYGLYSEVGSNIHVGDVEMEDDTTGTSDVDTVKDVASSDMPSHVSSMLGDDQWLPLLDSEKWAGPAFFNSPPPSSLPLPSFSMKQSRTQSLELSSIASQQVESLSFGFTSAESLFSHCPPPILRSGSGCTLDVTFATKDLRRMLNLDFLST